MKELLSLISEYEKLSKKGERSAMATVIEVIGSAYRRPGARMLVSESGITVGSVSGGCLERDVIDQCLQAIAAKQASLLKYDTSHDDDDVLGSGNGCAGSILISVEPLTADEERNPLRCISQRLLSGEGKGNSEFVLVSVTHATALLAAVIGLRGIFSTQSENSQASSHGTFVNNCALANNSAFANKLLGADETLLSLADGFATALKQDLCAAGSSNKTLLKTYELGAERIDLFFERISAPPRLFIFGAGHDAPALAELAHNVGMLVTVLDHRKSFADLKRFPQAERVLAYRPEDGSSWPQLDSDSHCVVMSHNLLVDKVVLAKLLQHELPYLGVLGPKLRTEKILRQLTDEGHTLAAQSAERMHAPIGLDIGAETPEQIALSIVAEIQAVSARREAGFLRNRKSPIHDPAKAGTRTRVSAAASGQNAPSADTNTERVTRDIQCSTTSHSSL